MRTATSPSLDRPARDRLAAAVRGGLSREVSLTELWAAADAAAHPPKGAADDDTVELVGWRIIELLEDVELSTEIPPVRDWLHRDEAGALRRLLLVLESDGRLIERVRRRIWSSRQILAAFGLALSVILLARSGWGWDVLPALLPGFLLSVLLHLAFAEVPFHFPSEPVPPSGPYGPTGPFASFEELAAVHHSITDPSRRAIPPAVGGRARRSHSPRRPPVKIGGIDHLPGWFIGSPLALLVQCLPEAEWETSVRLPA